jgi:hypothetical protein
MRSGKELKRQRAKREAERCGKEIKSDLMVWLGRGSGNDVRHRQRRRGSCLWLCGQYRVHGSEFYYSSLAITRGEYYNALAQVKRCTQRPRRLYISQSL